MQSETPIGQMRLLDCVQAGDGTGTEKNILRTQGDAVSGKVDFLRGTDADHTIAIESGDGLGHGSIAEAAGRDDRRSAARILSTTLV